MNEEFSQPASDTLQAVIRTYREPEESAVERLIELAKLPEDQLIQIQAKACELVKQVRSLRMGQGGLDAFLLQYDLSSEEGIALMCLAEALLRIPDKETIDKLIRDKISSGDWGAHLGKSHSLFVNSATWALMFTGKLVDSTEHSEKSLSNTLKKLFTRTSEPVIRQSVSQAMRLLGRQFVMGRTISEAIRRAKDNEAKGYRYSYDMLGEAALTEDDAIRYFESYQKAIEAIAESGAGKGPYESPGISVKLSALHPRYEVAQYLRVKKELLPRLKELARGAQKANIGFTIDAEESERLVLSLELIEGILSDPNFEGWDGFGLAVQAYQKRAPYVLDWLAEKARKYGRRLMVRLVKGAYWDTEIKNTQMEGLADYAVYTQKSATDISYIACVKKLLANADVLYPQFATHNAYTVAAVMTLAKQNNANFEFQCLHGMGDALYDPIVGFDEDKYRCRIYAPVGTHEDLLAYLVRRLLENGANSSFVNRIIDESLPVESLAVNPITQWRDLPHKRHPAIPLPKQLYGDHRKNSEGLDLSDPSVWIPVLDEMAIELKQSYTAEPSALLQKNQSKILVSDPSCRARHLGEVIFADTNEANLSMDRAKQAFPQWNALPMKHRADLLLKLADYMENIRPALMALLVREAGKTIPDAVNEVREAVDFCHYYAAEAMAKFAEPTMLHGPTGETNLLSYAGRGVMVCISPWNFPLAIFLGQVLSALVMGNTVVAKPAEQTSLIAATVVRGMHHIGFPETVIQLLPGKGEVVGPALLAHPHLAGVIFTGSTEVAKRIQRALADRPGPILPLIAETGGQNAMIVDSSALPEQVVKDVIRSAFYSAGQRCSALRVLFIQEDIAPKVLAMLQGAMAELEIGDPWSIVNDIGPVIDEEALSVLEAHMKRMQGEASLLYQVPLKAGLSDQGTFFGPAVFEIRDLSVLEKEVFGPILHVIRFKSQELDNVVEQINKTGYGLTFGIHSRINETVNYLVNNIHAGNTYVNRNMTGAVVGVQPFGGEGLSGTGPKAGGPNYLPRLGVERLVTVNTTAAGGNASLMSL